MRTLRLLVSLFVTLFVLSTLTLTSSQAGDVSLAWDAPTTNTDGTSLTDLAGYYVYYWQDAWEAAQAMDVGNQTTYTVTGLTAGATYHLTVTAYTSAGVESDFSNQLTVDATPVDTDGDGLTDTDEQTVYGTDPRQADSDGDGLADGAEVAYWGAAWAADPDGDGLSNVLDPDADNDGVTDGDELAASTDPRQADSDGDGVSDGDELAAGTDPTDATSHPQLALPFAVDVGEVVADHTWQRIPLQGDFVNPVVVIASLEVFGDDAAVARLRQVSPDGFELQLQEWADTDGFAPLATVGYLVLERGVHVLADGTRIEAGQFDTNATDTWVEVSLTTAFAQTPVVFTTVSSFNGNQPVTGRLDQVQTTSFAFQLQEGEGYDGGHTRETVTYVAWEPAVGHLGPLAFEAGTISKVTHTWQTALFTEPFATAPVIVAGMQTTKGSDTATVQWRDRDLRGLAVQIAEEQSGDQETNHTNEEVGFLAITPLAQ
jgi:hypothetical protein